MSSIPSVGLFKKIEKLRPYMEEYNSRLIFLFEQFLISPSAENLIPVFELRRQKIASSSENSYKTTKLIHIISDIVIKEFGADFTPITNGSNSHNEAIDRYHKAVFMLRRPAFLTDINDKELVLEANRYILHNKISPIAISYILNNELIGIPDKACDYWRKILAEAGLYLESEFLLRLFNTEYR